MKELKQSIKRMFGGRFRAGSYSAFAALIVIVIAIVVNMIFSTLPATATQIDLTSQSLYSLSDQTKQIIAALDEDVNIYIICTQNNENETIERLLQRYEGLSSHIKVQSVDPTLEPTFLDKYDIEISELYENSLLVECGSRFRLVGYDSIFVTDYEMDYYSYSYTYTTTFDGESVLTTAIHYVSSDDLPKVYTLSGHGETELSNSVTEMLEKDNFEVESLSLLSMDAVPEDATAVIINAPTSDLSEDEADLLISYLANGGNIALTTGYIEDGEMTQLLRVTSSMGLTTGTGIVIEGSGQKHLNRYAYYLLPTIESHDITDALKNGGYYILVPLAQPIIESGEGDAEITYLLTTSDSAYTKADGLDTKTTAQEDGDEVGMFHVAAVAEGTGKLFWVTCDTFLNSSIDAAVSNANSNLFLNALNWMGGQEESISIRAKSLDSEGLTLTGSESSMWSIIMIAVIPLALVVIGIVVWVRRKRR